MLAVLAVLALALSGLLMQRPALAAGTEPAHAVSVPAASSDQTAKPVAASSASAERTTAEGIVRLKDRKVFSILSDHEGRSATDRAREATHALERAFDSKEGDARFERAGGAVVVFVGKTPIVELTEHDAAAAKAATLEAYAADVTAKVQAAISQERKRSAIANTVFSVALVVFAGLIAFLLLDKISQLGTRARDWVEDNPDRIPSLRLGGIELLRPAAIEAFLTLGISVAKRIAQVGLLYAWLIFALSLFESTKGYTDRLTGLVLGPISGFLARVGTGLPLAVVTALAIFATVLLVRFTGLFFAGVARGETTLDWVPQDLATPVGVVVRIGIVVVGLILASPLLTGSDDGVLSRAGIAALVSFGLASTPVLACGVAGAIAVFGRRLRPGEFVDIAGKVGRVRAVTLLEVVLDDPTGCEVRLPHLLALLHPTRVMGSAPIVSVELVVDPRATQVRVHEVLSGAAAKVGATPRVELVSIDVDGALYRVTVGVGPQLVGPVVAPARRSRAARAGHASVPPPPNPALTPSGPLSAAAVAAAASARIVSEGLEAISRPTNLGVTTTVQLASLLADALAREGIGLGRRSSHSLPGAHAS